MDAIWSPGIVLALVLSAGIGLSLGLVGGGGSIVTVPLLVYVAGMPPQEAVALSLPIVGATALAGAALQFRAGNVDLRAATVFGATGMVGAMLGSPLTRLVPPRVLMLLFAALMLVVGARLARGGEGSSSEGMGECRPVRCGLAGLGVGVLTGFLGVGGGFLIVPALLRFARAPVRRAIGTSLLIIAANSAAGFIAHRADLRGHLWLAAVFAGAALVGLLWGVELGRKMHPVGLKRAFGGLALAVAVYVAATNLGPFLATVARG